MEATLLKSDGAMDVPPAFVPGTYVTSASTVGSFYDGVPKGSQMTSTSRPKAMYGQRFPCPAVFSSVF